MRSGYEGVLRVYGDKRINEAPVKNAQYKQQQTSKAKGPPTSWRGGLVSPVQKYRQMVGEVAEKICSK